MSIDARIASVRPVNGDLVLKLASYRASDGVMSIPGTSHLIVKSYTTVPHAGQQIWGNAAGCIVEAGNGGERILYERHGNRLVEVNE